MHDFWSRVKVYWPYVLIGITPWILIRPLCHLMVRLLGE